MLHNTLFYPDRRTMGMDIPGNLFIVEEDATADALVEKEKAKAKKATAKAEKKKNAAKEAEAAAKEAEKLKAEAEAKKIEPEECVTCMDAHASVRYRRCGHSCMCDGCNITWRERLREKALEPSCPICCAPVMD